MFLGVDSGMATLVSSVGTPVLFCKNERPIEYSCNHNNKHFVLSENHIELMSCLDSYKKGGIEYYLANARNAVLFTRRQDDNCFGELFNKGFILQI